MFSKIHQLSIVCFFSNILLVNYIFCNRSVFFNRGSAETDRNCLGRNSQPQLFAVVAIPLFHSILAAMNRTENSSHQLFWLIAAFVLRHTGVSFVSFLRTKRRDATFLFARQPLRQWFPTFLGLRHPTKQKYNFRHLVANP